MINLINKSVTFYKYINIEFWKNILHNIIGNICVKYLISPLLRVRTNVINSSKYICHLMIRS